jgi:hypothetical protein
VKFLMQYGLLGVFFWLLTILAFIFIGLWVIVKLVMAIWPWLLGAVLVWVIYKLVRRQAKREG